MKIKIKISAKDETMRIDAEVSVKIQKGTLCKSEIDRVRKSVEDSIFDSIRSDVAFFNPKLSNIEIR